MATQNVAEILGWYASHRRDLPWRRPDATPWAVLVSEVMLQQTPVARVLQRTRHGSPGGRCQPRWPPHRPATPSGVGPPRIPEARTPLHATARILTQRHGGEVPASLDALLALPGIGSYTAAAVASFAFGQRQAVLDHQRAPGYLRGLVNGQEPATRSPSAAEVRLPRRCFRRSLTWRHDGRGGQELARWCARPRGQPAPVARWPIPAPGGWPEAQPPATAAGASRRTTAPTGSAGAACRSPQGGGRPGRRPRGWMPSGRTRYSAPGRSTASSRTALSTRSQTAASPSPLDRCPLTIRAAGLCGRSRHASRSPSDLRRKEPTTGYAGSCPATPEPHRGCAPTARHPP